MFSYTFELDWSRKDNMITGVNTTLTYNWDNKLRTGSKNNVSVEFRYDPQGNRALKKVTASGQTTRRRYVVDIVGSLPTILLELDPDHNYKVMETYIYANDRLIAKHSQRDENHYEQEYAFYLYDRLGSVRQVIDEYGVVRNRYTYDPFGEIFTSEKQESIANPFRFTGQYFDSELGQYHLRARQYDPHISRFTAYDPVDGKFTEPLTLHKYLYCKNNSINLVLSVGIVG